MEQVRVPLSRFRRELRKWLRVCQDVDVIITKNGVDHLVAVGHERMELLRLISDGTINGVNE